MGRDRFPWLFGLFTVVIFLAFHVWQSHSLGQARLTTDDIERYLATADRQLAMPPDEKSRVLARWRAWAETDDGRPFYMLNLMRYYDELRSVPGAPAFTGTPREANDYYESVAGPLVIKRGGYPIIAGHTQGQNLLDAAPALDDWSRVVVVRYPNRRAFFELLADPAYGPIEPYKLMSMQVLLVPLSGELVIPDLRWIVGGALLSLFLAVGWRRAARQKAALRLQSGTS